MAAIVFFFFVFILTLSSTIHARESQFFNKFSNTIPKESQPLNTNQQDPTFIPQSQDSASYGLYGHESGQLPPSATVTTTNGLPANLPENYNPVAYTTPIEGTTQHAPDEFPDNSDESNMQNSENKEEEFVGTNGRYYYAGDNGYKPQKQGFDEERFMDGGNTYKSVKQGESKYGTSNNAEMYKSEKQGMSDTRFLENGKYYYDVNMENRNGNVNMNRGFDSRMEYNTYGNNGKSYYNNNRYNSNGGYENKDEFQVDEFNP